MGECTSNNRPAKGGYNNDRKLNNLIVIVFVIFFTSSFNVDYKEIFIHGVIKNYVL